MLVDNYVADELDVVIELLDDEEDEEDVDLVDEEEDELEVEVVLSVISPQEGEAEVPIFSNIVVAAVVPSTFTKRHPWE